MWQSAERLTPRSRPAPRYANGASTETRTANESAAHLELRSAQMGRASRAGLATRELTVRALERVQNLKKRASQTEQSSTRASQLDDERASWLASSIHQVLNSCSDCV